MSCEQIEMLLVQYLCDELDEQARATVAAHLAACAGCSERLGDLRLTTNLLRDALHAGPAPVLDSAHRAAMTAAVAKTPVGSAKAPAAGRVGQINPLPAWLTAPLRFNLRGRGWGQGLGNVLNSARIPRLPTVPFRISRKAALAAACVIITTGLAGLVVNNLGSSPHAASKPLARAMLSRNGRGEVPLSGGTKLAYDFTHRDPAHAAHSYEDFERTVAPLGEVSKQKERLATKDSDSDPTAVYSLPAPAATPWNGLAGGTDAQGQASKSGGTQTNATEMASAAPRDVNIVARRAKFLSDDSDANGNGAPTVPARPAEPNKQGGGERKELAGASSPGGDYYFDYSQVAGADVPSSVRAAPPAGGPLMAMKSGQNFELKLDGGELDATNLAKRGDVSLAGPGAGGTLDGTLTAHSLTLDKAGSSLGVRAGGTVTVDSGVTMTVNDTKGINNGTFTYNGGTTLVPSAEEAMKRGELGEGGGGGRGGKELALTAPQITTFNGQTAYVTVNGASPQGQPAPGPGLAVANGPGSFNKGFEIARSKTAPPSDAPTGVKTYDIRDMVAKVPDFNQAHDFDLNGILKQNNGNNSNGGLFGNNNGNNGTGTTVASGATGPTRQELLDQLQTMVKTTVGEAPPAAAPEPGHELGRVDGNTKFGTVFGWRGDASSGDEIVDWNVGATSGSSFTSGTEGETVMTSTRVAQAGAIGQPGAVAVWGDGTLRLGAADSAVAGGNMARYVVAGIDPNKADAAKKPTSGETGHRTDGNSTFAPVGGLTIAGSADAWTSRLALEDNDLLMGAVKTNAPVKVPGLGDVPIVGNAFSDSIGRKSETPAEVSAGVPVLDKIPTINRLFTNKSSNKDDSTQLVLVKPTIIIQGEQAGSRSALFGESAERTLGEAGQQKSEVWGSNGSVSVAGGSVVLKSGNGPLSIYEANDLAVGQSELNDRVAPKADVHEIHTTVSIPDRGTILIGGQRPKTREMAGADSDGKKSAIAQDSLPATRAPASGTPKGQESEDSQSYVKFTDESGQDRMVAKEWLDAQRSSKTSAPATQPAAIGAIPQPAAAPTPTAVKADDATKEAAPETAPKFVAGPVNPWVLTQADRYSTFALDVDTASYRIALDYLRRGYRPPAASVRMEEFVNAFDYNYPRQSQGTFNVHAQAARSPFAPAGQNLTLLKIGVQGKVIGREGRKPTNLVFVIDTSGSMARADRLPLVQEALMALVRQLSPRDKVSIVSFSNTAMLLAQGEIGVPEQRQALLGALASIRCQGSTNLGQGLKLGYATARNSFVSGATNRVILCSDGVANVGPADGAELLQTVETERRNGISMTCVGVGAGSYNDALLENLADKGDGNYVFVDSPEEARRLFVEQMAALQPIAQDAKIQVEFNRQRVRRYRLIGYENRAIADKDFRNDAIVAGAVGSGQSSTALYELELAPEPAGAAREESGPSTPGTQVRLAGENRATGAGSLGTVYVRYRNIDSGKIEEICQPLPAAGAFAGGGTGGTNGEAVRLTVQGNPRFFLAACAAQTAEILRQSEHAQGRSLEQVRSVLQEVCGQLPLDARARELLWMVERAGQLPEATH